ncbi:MAG: OmpH family outer membrane protein [Acidobacteriota bacterium]
MRQFRLVGCCVGAWLLLCGSALWAQGVKIGFVNSQEILFQTKEGQEGMAALQDYMAQKRQEFDRKNQELNQLQQEYQTKRATLNVDAAAEMERQINQKQIELRRFQEDIQADLNERQEQLLDRISQKVQQVITDYAKQNGYHAVFVRDQSQVYVAPELDITQDIIRLYNERFPGSQGAAGAAAPTQQP